MTFLLLSGTWAADYGRGGTGNGIPGMLASLLANSRTASRHGYDDDSFGYCW